MNSPPDPEAGRPSLNVVTEKAAAKEKPERGRGLFAVAPIARHEVIAVWGGRIVPAAEFHRLPAYRQSLSLQVEDDFFLVPHGESAADLINHSCAPNAGMAGQIVVIALRDILPGEEICYDYAMTDGSGYDEFACGCGSLHCRGRVTGRDWERPELWERYEGYFSPYLERRIARRVLGSG